MKKYISFLLIFLSFFIFTACGTVNEDKDLTADFSSSVPESETETPSAEEMNSQINSSTVLDEKNIPSETETIIKGAKGADTLTGLSPLPHISYAAGSAPKGISTKKLSHSHGPASGGKPHHTVVEFQKTFEKYGAVTLDTVSKDKVLYLTFDCGYEYENLTQKVLDVLKEKNVPATFFCTLDHIKSEHSLISRMITEGHIVGNHSTTHPSFADITREQMAKEIEDTENYLRENFGYAAKYFRFPAGEYTESALELVESLGYTSVFWSVAYDDWNTEQVRGKNYAIEKVMSRLHDGAIILLHSVSKDNADALGEIIDKARAEGYEFRALTDYKA